MKRFAAIGIALCILTTLSGVFGIDANAKTQAQNPTNRSYAWLDELYIRETTAQYTSTNTLIPVTSRPYSRTYTEFSRDVDNIVAAYPIRRDTVEEGFLRIMESAYSAMRALGVTESYAEQRRWLENEGGIIYPTTPGEYDELYTGLLYGAMKHNLFRVLYSQDVVVPKNTPLERAVVLYLAAMTDPDKTIPLDGVNTVRGFSVETMRAALIKKGYPVTEATSDDDVYRYYSIMFINDAYRSDAGGPVLGNDATEAQINAYYFVATVSITYGIKVQPAAMAAALELSGTQRSPAVRRLLLKTMIEEKGGSLGAHETDEDAFNKTLQLGYFTLENGFYSDIYKYRVNLDYRRDSIRVTPLCYAEKMPGGDPAKALIKIDGLRVVNKRAATVRLNSAKASQILKITVDYLDGSVEQSRTYEITVYQGTKIPPVTTTSPPLPTQVTGTTPFTTPFVTDYRGFTYSFGEDATLPDGHEFVTDEDGNIIGVDTPDETTQPTNSSTAEPTTAQTDAVVPPAEPSWKRGLLPIVLGAGAVLGTGGAVLLVKKRKQAKNP